MTTSQTRTSKSHDSTIVCQRVRQYTGELKSHLVTWISSKNADGSETKVCIKREISQADYIDFVVDFSFSSDEVGFYRENRLSKYLPTYGESPKEDDEGRESLDRRNDGSKVKYGLQNPSNQRSR